MTAPVRRTVAELCAAASPPAAAVGLSGDVRADGRRDHHTLAVVVRGAQIGAQGLAYPDGSPVDGPVDVGRLVPEGIAVVLPEEIEHAPSAFRRAWRRSGMVRLG